MAASKHTCGEGAGRLLGHAAATWLIEFATGSVIAQNAAARALAAEHSLPGLVGSGDALVRLQRFGELLRPGEVSTINLELRELGRPGPARYRCVRLADAEGTPRLLVAEVSGCEDESGEAGDPGDGAGVAIDMGRLAHELRTPLSAIAALAEILRDGRLGVLPDRHRAYAADIHDSAMHALSVLATTLEAGSGHGGAGGLNFAEVDPAALIASCVSAMLPLAERAGVRLSAELPQRAPHLIVDRRCIRQIVLNLVTNALKFTPPGGEVVVMLGHDVDGPVRIEVRDTGDGISPEELDRILAAKEGPGVSRSRTGTGFGLPLVRRLAAENGGTFAIESVLGKGTRAWAEFGRDRVVPV